MPNMFPAVCYRAIMSLLWTYRFQFLQPREGETVSIEIQANVWVAVTIMFLRIITTVRRQG
jgi:hypothetical protein